MRTCPVVPYTETGSVTGIQVFDMDEVTDTNDRWDRDFVLCVSSLFNYK